jgi:cytochrome c oxidase subunit 3
VSEHQHAHHFASFEQQVVAARLGMWVFLGSETLLFAALFGLYAAYRAEYGAAFEEGMRHMEHELGAVNTLILLTSSLFAALAVEALERGGRRVTLGLTAATVGLGVAFLTVKGIEYAAHIRDGMVPNGHGAFFLEHRDRGLPVFVTLYYLMTGLHALHVTAGLVILLWLGRSVMRGTITETRAHPFELGVLYWHLVDTLWVFLWPMFYFAGKA